MDTQDPLNTYEFPTQRLAQILSDSARTPVVLVACGSFSPITYLHLRMFEMAVDYIRQSTSFEVIGRYLSPVNDSYKKPGLLTGEHRLAMCSIAAEQTSTTLMVDPWETYHKEYQRTAVVLDHFDYEINQVRGGVRTASGERRRVRIMLLAGSDLISTMSEPGVWSEADLEHILGRYGTFIIERSGTDVAQATDALSAWRSNIYIIRQLIQNDVSSTKVRLFIRRGFSVRYLLPIAVIEYIEQHGLYLDESVNDASRPPKEILPKGQSEGPSRPATNITSS